MATVDINALTVAQSVSENSSKKSMIYRSDTGVDYGVVLDENIGESMGFTDYADNSNVPMLPQGLKMRTVSFADSSGKVKGQYSVGTPTTPIFVEGGTIKVPRKGSAAGVVCTVTGAQGEKRRMLSAADTGQQSGDNT